VQCLTKVGNDRAALYVTKLPKRNAMPKEARRAAEERAGRPLFERLAFLSAGKSEAATIFVA